MRRRRPLSVLVLGVVVLIAALALALRPQDEERRGGGGQATAAAPGRTGPAPSQTLVNGPLTASASGRRPLAVKLEDLEDPVRIAFGRPPRAGLLFDLDTGEVLWRRAPTRVLPVASLTKMMTALVVAGRQPPQTKVRITKEALEIRGSAVGVLPRGRRVRLETMLHGLLLVSGNDAAIALSQRVSGTVAGFVRQMNARARSLGLACTRYADPDGLSRGSRSCAVDLAAQARAVLDEPRLAAIVRRRRASLPLQIKGGRLDLTNTNPLLRAGYPGVLGVKTGFTNPAGRCLVAAARRRGRRLGVVLLHSPDPGRQARQLLNRGFRLRE